MTSASRAARNACDAPGGLSEPNSRSALASWGRRPRACSAARKPSSPPARNTLAGASAVTPSAPGSSRPSGDRTVSSAGCPPSGSITVTRSSPRSSTTVADPGLTHHDSKVGSTGLSVATAMAAAYALAAGAFASSLSACSESCLASSRLPVASSFLISFSTTRRL
jgi:hypothetical protein